MVEACRVRARASPPDPPTSSTWSTLFRPPSRSVAPAPLNPAPRTGTRTENAPRPNHAREPGGSTCILQPASKHRIGSTGCGHD
jgi:hypothetical protein